MTTWGRHQGKAENMNRPHPGAPLNLHDFYFEVYNWLPLNGLLISTWQPLACQSSQSATKLRDCLFESTITKSTWIAVQTIHTLWELLNTAMRNTGISKSSSSEHWQNGSVTGRQGATVLSTRGKQTCLGHITTAPREYTIRIIWSRWSGTSWRTQAYWPLAIQPAHHFSLTQKNLSGNKAVQIMTLCLVLKSIKFTRPAFFTSSLHDAAQPQPR